MLQEIPEICWVFLLNKENFSSQEGREICMYSLQKKKKDRAWHNAIIERRSNSWQGAE